MITPEEISAHADQVVILSDAIGVTLGKRDSEGVVYVNSNMLMELIDMFGQRGAAGEEVDAIELATAIVSLSLAASRQTLA